MSSTKEKESTLASRVYFQLREEIVTGKIEQGQKLRESELAEQYGISRVPLREAIHRLENIGLAVRIPHVGCRVIEITKKMLTDIYQVRIALEGTATFLATQNMTNDEIDAIKLLLRQHEDTISKEEGKKGYKQEEENRDFHFLIYKGSRNQWLEEYLHGRLYQLIRMSRLHIKQDKNRAVVALKQHWDIVDAIAERDAELAEFLMRRHIEKAGKIAEKQWEVEHA